MGRSDSRDKRRLADLFRRALLDLISAHEGRILGWVWVQTDGEALKPDATYCYAVRDTARHFDRYVADQKPGGLMIADGRSPKPNVTVAPSIFTQKWRTGATRTRTFSKFHCSHPATTTSASR
jgi:hypothetical protein